VSECRRPYYWSRGCLGILVTRLRAREWFRRHPEILQERIKRPHHYPRLKRTGTTFAAAPDLQRLAFLFRGVLGGTFPGASGGRPGGAQRIAAAKAEIACAAFSRIPTLGERASVDAMGADETS